MLSLENDFIREFPINSRTDRDCEVPLLVEYIKSKSPITSLLDVGAHYSSSSTHYAHQIRPLITQYDGVDIIYDPEAKKILNTFYTGNANEINLPQYEMVICVSTIEHAGLSTYKADYVEERMKLFMKCLELTKKYMWISFPVGQEYVYPNELAPVTDKQLKRWEILTSNFKVKERFFYNQGPQANHPWYEHTKRDVAVKIPYLDFIGNQSICVLEIEK